MLAGRRTREFLARGPILGRGHSNLIGTQRRLVEAEFDPDSDPDPDFQIKIPELHYDSVSGSIG